MGLNGQWLSGLPSDVAARVRSHTMRIKNGRREPNGSWWLRQSPSTGMASSAELLRRDDRRRVIERLPVIVNGAPVPPFDRGDGMPPAP